MAIPINADHDKLKEGTAETALERNEHEPRTTAASEGRVIGQVNYVGNKNNIFLLALTINNESNFRHTTQ